MSWLNLNESLTTLKGQLSNFASGVLADGIVNNPEDERVRKKDSVEEQDFNLNTSVRQNASYNDNNWKWETPTLETPTSTNGVSYGLQAKIDLLEKEKKELVNNLEQLDLDHQQTTEKLLSLKDNLQSNYNELTNDYEKLKKEYGEVLNENMEKTKEVEAMRNRSDSSSGNPEEEESQLRQNADEVKLQMLEKKVKLVEDDAKIAQGAFESGIAEKRELEQKCLDLNLHCEEIIKKCHEETEKVEQLTFDKAQLIIDKELLQGTVASLRNDKNDLLLTVEEFQKLQNQTKTEESDQTSEPFAINDLQNKISDLEETCQNLQYQNNQLLIDTEKVQEQHHMLQELTSENQQLKHQQDVLESKIKTTEKLQSDLERKLEEASASSASAENRIRNLEEMYNKSRIEKQNLHEKYINIVTESMKKHMDMDMSVSLVASEEQPEILEFANKVETLLKLLLDFKSKSESLEKEACQITHEKNNVIAEKNFEIEKLLQNSEILSQEVITKTQAIKDYEDECAELMKNNDLLIIELQNFKKSGLQTISESNEDNLLLMESQLENANKKIQDMEIIISDLENSKQESSDEVQTELDYIKRQLNMTGQELSKSKADNHELATHQTELESERNTFKTALEKAKTDYENIEYKYTEMNVGLESLKEENEECRRKIAILDAKCRKLDDSKLMSENKIELLQKLLDDQKQQLNIDEEKLAEKDLQIRSYVERLQNSKMSETGLKLQVDTISKELQSAQKRLQEEYEKVKNPVENVALEAQIVELVQARNELIALVTAKHEENVKYHAEIQRLGTSEENLTKRNEDLDKLTDQNNFLREKCEVLAQNLLEEQSKTQKILADQNTASEKELSLMKELERLRVHLVEVEDTYTQELVQAELKNKEMQAKVNEIEMREKNSSSIYTSVSIRANQQVETLQTQLQLVSNQRDELRVKVSDLEDDNNKHVAALTNLQLVLEQFQKDKDKDVHSETERIRRQIAYEKKIQDDLRNDNSNLKMQLEESKQGLQAAARLTDQLEKCKKQVVNLKDEVSKLQEKLQKTEGTCKELSTQSDTKVDKSLIKNLVIGYISSSANDQKQILKIIATVLDFNKNESDKVYLNKPQNSGWLNSILHPQGLSSNSEITQESLSAAFVKFLEKESKPKVLPNLLTSTKQRRVSEDASSSCSTPPPIVLSEIVLPTFVDFGKNRNSSSILKDVLKDNT